MTNINYQHQSRSLDNRNEDQTRPVNQAGQLVPRVAAFGAAREAVLVRPRQARMPQMAIEDSQNLPDVMTRLWGREIKRQYNAQGFPIGIKSRDHFTSLETYVYGGGRLETQSTLDHPRNAPVAYQEAEGITDGKGERVYASVQREANCVYCNN
ncbi:hypothetical protein GGR54DRAFT_641862 [Hypoxylon sp. NC1633]|nr:hypothetical protein GGR54DRAFT_641862 [Hypoxylon sp. NC1633]